MKSIIRIILIVFIIIFFLFKQFHKPHSDLSVNNKPTFEQPSSTTPSKQNSPIDRTNQHLILTRHARCRMECRHIDLKEIKEILQNGTVNEKKSQADSRGMKYAFEGYTVEHQHLRVIFAPERDAIVVVTCIDLDNEWGCPSCN